MDARKPDTGVTPNLATIAELVTAKSHKGDRGKDEFLSYVNEVLPYSDIWCVPARRPTD